MKIGNEDQASAVVYEYWTALAERDWKRLRPLLSDEFEAYWPQSKELFKTADAFIEMNRIYPETRKFEFYNDSHSYDQWEHRDHYISEVIITSKMPDGRSVSLFAISHFEIEDGLIVSMREYWADCYPAPVWRSHLVEVQKL